MQISTNVIISSYTISGNYLCSDILSCECQDDSNDSIINSYKKHSNKKNADIPFGETTPMSQVSKFFCSIDSYLDNMNDWEIYDTIKMKYPGISIEETNDTIRKKAIIEMVQDDAFITDVLELYDMNILDFFRFMFRLCPSLFKGLFLKRVQSIVADKQYAKSIRFGNYTFKRKDIDDN